MSKAPVYRIGDHVSIVRPIVVRRVGNPFDLHADDAMVIATDFDELRRDGRTTSTDVTEDVTVECWGRLNRTEREEFAERGLFDLASRFVSDEYSAATSATEAA